MIRIHYLFLLIALALVAYSCVTDNEKDYPERQESERGIPQREPSERSRP